MFQVINNNLFATPSGLSEEKIDVLYSQKTTLIEKIISPSSENGFPVWYCQETIEYVILISGEASIEWENGTETKLSQGDSIEILPFTKHRVSKTVGNPNCIWLAIHLKS